MIRSTACSPPPPPPRFSIPPPYGGVWIRHCSGKSKNIRMSQKCNLSKYQTVYRYLRNRTHISMVHPPKASDLQAFRV